MTVDAARFEKLVVSLEQLTWRLSEVITELKVLGERQAIESRSLAALSERVEAEARERANLRRDLDKWVHRAWGAWGVLVLAFTVVTAVDWGVARSFVAPPPVAIKESAPPAKEGTK